MTKYGKLVLKRKIKNRIFLQQISIVILALLVLTNIEHNQSAVHCLRLQLLAAHFEFEDLLPVSVIGKGIN